jgi:hypothetical protein
MNRVQFQPGLSLPAFLEQFGTETQCENELEAVRWPDGFRCPRCGEAGHSEFRVGARKMFQCKDCRTQTSIISGTLFQGTRLPLTIWFLAIYLISQSKTGLSALALKRQLGVSYPTAWTIQHKLAQAMVEREALYALTGDVQIDDAYLGGERTGGKAGRGSENKVPFIAAVSLSPDGRPLYTKMIPVRGFSREEIAEWAEKNLHPECVASSDGLACFAGVTEAGCLHNRIVVAGRKPEELPEFHWVNTVLSNLKTSFGGAYHAFNFAKYGARYLGVFSYRFNRRFNLRELPKRLLVAAASIGPRPQRWLRAAESSC